MQQARAVLEQHGIDPDADVDDLTRLLEARGWRVSVEKVLGRGRGQEPRWSGHATLAARGGTSMARHPAHIAVTGARRQEVLTRIEAKVLEKEGRGKA